MERHFLGNFAIAYAVGYPITIASAVVIPAILIESTKTPK